MGERMVIAMRAHGSGMEWYGKGQDESISIQALTDVYERCFRVDESIVPSSSVPPAQFDLSRPRYPARQVSAQLPEAPPLYVVGRASCEPSGR